MYILIFDLQYDKYENDYVDVLRKNLLEYELVLLKNFEEAKRFYENHACYLVLIDFTTPEGLSFLQWLNNVNKAQRIITLGYDLRCSSTLGCDFCTEHYHKKRLVKPFNALNLHKLIRDFDKDACAYSNQFYRKEFLLNQIVKRYTYFSYDEKNALFSARNSDIQEVKQLVNLLSDLNEMKIEYKVLDEKSVKVL